MPVGGPGWRGRLISHAPQLGRMVMALSCPRSTRHAPTAQLRRGSGRHAAPNRGYCLPARSAAPIAPTHPEEEEE
ncbi:hypothetical protein [Paramuribaculum intestinale]|uniref:hypothetical protein n=1 Tax=Paramuribaculum intestinale TaxID=2094151 RepID=UPI0025A94179|nr:hypothetical protein [Paramuribaculum intestinale]